MSDVLRAIEKITAPIRRRVMNMFCRGVLNALTDETGAHQIMKGTLLDSEVLADGEFIGQYGFVSKPSAGAEYFVAFLNGDRSHPLVLAVNDPETRKTDLADGDAAVYTAKGNFIHLKNADGQILISVPPSMGKIRLEADSIEIHGRTGLKLDAGGCGVHYFPADIENYTVGAVTNVHNISPSEIP